MSTRNRRASHAHLGLNAMWPSTCQAVLVANSLNLPGKTNKLVELGVRTTTVMYLT